MQPGFLTKLPFPIRPSNAYQEAGQPVPVSWQVIPAVVLVIAIWLLVGLFQLKRLSRWIVVTLFAWWTVLIIVRMLFPPVVIPNPVRVYLVLCIPIALNVACVWYLTRKSFREYAVSYAAEKKADQHSSLMREADRKQTEKEIRRNKSN